MVLMSESGVYMIENVVTGERYVGSTTYSFSHRWANHKTKLRSGINHCTSLQDAWNAYGEEPFRFVMLEATSPESHLEREQFWMDHYRSLGLTLYNRCPRADSTKGLKMPAKIAERMRAYSTGRKKSDSERQKLSLALKNRRVSPETRARRVEAAFYDWPPVVAPDGVVHRFHNLEKLAREHDLEPNSMRAMIRGHTTNHKGWTRLVEGVEPSPYLGPIRRLGVAHTPVSPDGTEYPNVTNLAAFSREHGLSPSAMGRTCAGHYKHHHGWTCCPEKHRESILSS